MQCIQVCARPDFRDVLESFVSFCWKRSMKRSILMLVSFASWIASYLMMYLLVRQAGYFGLRSFLERSQNFRLLAWYRPRMLLISFWALWRCRRLGSFQRLDLVWTDCCRM